MVGFKDVLFSLKLSTNTFYNHFFQEQALKDLVSMEPIDERNFIAFSGTKEGLESLLELPILPSAIDSDNVITKILLSTFLNDSLSEDQKKYLYNMLDGTKLLTTGSGAYFISEQSDSQIVLLRKENWWGNPFNSWNIYFAIYPVRITYRFYNNRELALADLRKGKLDVLDDLTEQEKLALLNEPSITEKFHFYFLPVSNTFIAVHRKFSNAPPYPLAPGYWEGGFAVTFQSN